MIGPSIQNSDLETFRMSNSLIKDSYKFNLGATFEETLDNQVKEATKKAKDKATDVASEDKDLKKKKVKEKNPDELPNITQLTHNVERKNPNQTHNTYLLLERFKESRKLQEEDLAKGPREQALNNAHNVAGQALIQPVYDQGQRRMTRATLLEHWEKYAPTVTEDITKRSVRLDIPLLNDVQALVLRMHPDRTISASLLGSKEMGELIKQNKDKLDRNLRHHQLSLREFNTYRSELEFNNESGTRKKKKQAKPAKKIDLDLV